MDDNEVMMVPMSRAMFRLMITNIVKTEVAILVDVVRQESEERLVSRKDTAKRLNVTEQTLGNLEKRGSLIPIRDGRVVKYRESDIRAYIKAKEKKWDER